MSTKKTIKRLAVTLDETDPKKGYQRVSLVEKPAIQRGWVALAAAEQQPAKRVHLSEEAQKQILTGPILVPDQNILRLDAEGEPYYIFFSAEQIEKIARKLMQEGKTTETNDAHDAQLDGNTITELWLVTDPKQDKSAALGLDVPAGTLMISLHVADSEYWQNEVVTGNRTGFSIEGLFDFDEVKLAAQSAKHNKMKNRFLRMQLAIARALNLKLAQVELEDGRIVEVAEDGTVTVLDDEGEPGEALADGEHKLKGGGVLTVKDGKKAEEAPANSEQKVENAEEGTAGAAGDNAGAADDKTDTVKSAVEALAGVLEQTDAAKIAQQCKAALKALGVTELAAANVKLEAIPMADGSEFQLNPITRLLTDSAGKYVPTGYYACADGSYFKVNLDQYCYSIDEETYDRSIKLSEVELKLSETEDKLKLAEQQLSSESSTAPLLLSSDDVHLSEEQIQKLPRALQLTAHLRGE